MTDPTWGIVSTIKAPAKDILTFAAHHLDLGAHRVHIYLDAANDAARDALKAHPKCRVFVCDDGYWKRRAGRKGRPEKHQQRQSANATHCYRRDPQVDWLAHIDVDEFIFPDSGLSGQLHALPVGALSARIRPAEALAPDPDSPPPEAGIYLKATSRFRKDRAAQTEQIFPTYGAHLNGGFLSHVAGKVFVRTGHDKISLRIHNAFREGVMDANPAELPDTLLAHLHAPNWSDFLASYRFRMAQGSYRSELKPASGDHGLNMHALFSMLEAEGGEPALRAFFDEVCIATPALRARLSDHGLLRLITLDAQAKLARHFPDFA